ncbi:helix-hairpin-helix domain-containing protein [Metabacillus fastidiosus]|uniref:helix-hairpin-helix domain-containing protein n=1 Tax=Metabacillus fastidiosus TaxID=1458 RepID=UPI002E20C33C|nr:helix-hairpin-helix domain-containing protein [Metabacillus fastidiosus]
MEFIKQHKYPLIIITIVLSFLAFFYYSNSMKEEIDHELDKVLLQNNEENIEEDIENSAIEMSSEIVIDVKGAVIKPGVYVMESGDRIHHVIEKAGGLTADANQLSINLAALLEDGMVVYVPKQGEEENIAASLPIITSSSGSTKINVNKATSEELQTLSGIGPSKAEAIISYRNESGPFKTEEDLLKVSGIGQKTFEKLKENITVK